MEHYNALMGKVSGFLILVGVFGLALWFSAWALKMRSK